MSEQKANDKLPRFNHTCPCCGEPMTVRPSRAKAGGPVVISGICYVCGAVVSQ